MTQPDERIRDSLRDLIPGYQGPADPYTRVGVAIRRRRSRQRVLIAISSVAVLAVLAAVPLAIRGWLPGGATGSAAGSRRGGPVPVKVSQQVAAGTVAAGDWAVRAVQLNSGAKRCLYADDAVFQAAAICFDAWRAGGRVSWATVDAIRPGIPISAVFGVAASTVGSVIVLLSNNTQQTVRAMPSPDLPDTRFFALVIPTAGLTVRNISTMTADGTLAELAVSTSGTPPCRPTPTETCARPTG